MHGAAPTRLLDRYPFNSPFVRRVLVRWALPFWFVLESALGSAKVLSEANTYLFTDGKLYLAATRAWLAGTDPWDVAVAGNYYAAPPPSLLPLVPLAPLPDAIALPLLIAALVVGAVLTVRMLRLPWWWLLFPPLVQALWAANVHAILIPLVLAGGGALAGQGVVAAFLKIYALVPMAILGRWRAVVLAAIALVATAPFLPWATFLGQLPLLSERLAAQSTGELPIALVVLLSPAIVAAMILAGRTNAAWLTVPAIWPSHQFYYGTFAMATRSPIAAAIVAVPATGAPLVALFVMAALAWRRGERLRLPARAAVLRPSAQ